MTYVLVVDDEPVNRDIIEDILLMDDYELEMATDGIQCLEKIKQRLPDLLLLDIAMPRMNGIEVCKTLRKDKETQDLPIILLSGFASDADIEEGMAAGANDYLPKPFSPNQLWAAIAKLNLP